MPAPARFRLTSGDPTLIGTVPAGEAVIGVDETGDYPFFKIGTTLTYFGTTQEQVEDFVGNMIDTSSVIVVSYDDPGRSLTLTVANGSITEAMLAFAVTTQAEGDAITAALAAHLGDSTDAHDASAISFVPTGTIAATDVQGAVAEVATDAAADLAAGLALQLHTSQLDIDGTLAANSDAKVASQKAVKTYADALIAANDAMVFKGVIDCSANPNYPAADRGHTYKVSVAGKIGGASGPNVEVGDTLLCITDGTAAGTHAAVGAQWNIVQANLDGAVIGPASSTDNDFAQYNGSSGKLIKGGLSFDTDGTLAANSDTKVASQKAVKTYADAKVAAEAVLARNGDNITGGTVADARIAATIARDSEVSAAITASEAGQVRDGDAAGGVLSGTYPNPGFAVDMATQAELDAGLALQLHTSQLDIDGTLAANSDAKVASQKAVKTYADALIAANDAMVFKGVIDCSANPNYPAADRGWAYKVSVAGKIGGALGPNVEVGDTLFCITDGTAAGNHGVVGANWNIVQANLDGAVIGPAVSVDGGLALYNGTTGKVIKADGLTPANDDVLQRKAGAWSNRTMAQFTADLNLATALLRGLLSPELFKKQRDTWTDPFNELGCDPTGATDASAAIIAWMALSTTSCTLVIAADRRLRCDNIPTSKQLRIIGMDRRTSVLSTGSATATMFDVTGDNVYFDNLRFEAGAAAQNLALRTGLTGYAVDSDATADATQIRSCDFIGFINAINLEGQLPIVDDVNIREYGNLTTGGQCIRIDTGAGGSTAGGDVVLNNVNTDNGSNPANWAGIRLIACASIRMKHCNIIHTTNGLAVEPRNGGTIPSIKASDCFFDNGTIGVRFNPTGTGVWYRSTFVNCWMGSNSAAGVRFEGPAFDGIQFIGCDILGNPVGIDANAGGGKWRAQNCQIAGGSTAGIRLAPTANHFPIITGCNITPQLVGGAFGANAVGIIIGTGTYAGLVIDGNDVSGNTSPLTLGTVTVADWKNFRIIDNTGINPRGAVTGSHPATPVSATTYTNTTGFRVLILFRAVTATTSVAINGLAAFATATGANAIAYVTLEPGGTVAFVGTGALTWQWHGQ